MCTSQHGFSVCRLQEFAPSDEELSAYRKGEDWDPEKAKELVRLKVGAGSVFRR